MTDAASVVPIMPPLVEAGIILPPAEAGPLVPDLPRDAGVTARDTGTSAPRDAGTSTPVDSGSQTPLDSGSQTPLDSGSQTPLDSGSQTPLDSGAQPADTGGGTSNTSAAAPAYSTTSACGKCTCMRCATQITACVASTDTAKNAQCTTVRSCAEKNSCTGTGCYCGGATVLACLAPAGPCMQEIESAAGVTGATEVQAASMDPENPVGRSVLVGECQLLNCASECGLQ